MYISKILGKLYLDKFELIFVASDEFCAILYLLSKIKCGFEIYYIGWCCWGFVDIVLLYVIDALIVHYIYFYQGICNEPSKRLCSRTIQKLFWKPFSLKYLNVMDLNHT